MSRQIKTIGIVGGLGPQRRDRADDRRQPRLAMIEKTRSIRRSEKAAVWAYALLAFANIVYYDSVISNENDSP